MNLKDLLKPFAENEVEWRIGSSGNTRDGSIWGTCLAYIQSRAIMSRLDEVVGPEGWRVSYRFVAASDRVEPGVIAVLGIRVGDQWIEKEDGAEQTDIESFKGGLSSALKRAGAVWGIGRYLYDLESGFVTVVTRGTPGARYAKLKDGTEFYWTPPSLPKWALPIDKPKTQEGPSNPEVASVPSGLRVAPKAEDLPEDAGEYVIQFGKKHNGRKLKEIGLKEARSYVDYLEKSAAEKRMALSQEALILKRAVSQLEAKLGTHFEMKEE